MIQEFWSYIGKPLICCVDGEAAFSVQLSSSSELGFTEKQQLAHGVLLRLLRVTSQLPMIEFSHALDTLETLTDAYKLEQRVNLTIRHDNEES